MHCCRELKFGSMQLNWKLTKNISLIILIIVFCNGRKLKIKLQPDPVSISEGADGVINWTYCKANVSSILSFIVYRDLGPGHYLPLLSMDLNGDVFYTEHEELGIKRNRIDIKANDHIVSFTIRNVSTNDSGYYRLEIQRREYEDLESRVQIIVKPLSKYNYIVLIIRYSLQYELHLYFS